MPRLRDRDESVAGRGIHEYQEEFRLIELAMSKSASEGDVEGTARALSAVIYGKPLRLLTDWSSLLSRIVGVTVELSHDDVFDGEYVSYREAWQIAFDTSFRLRARVSYLEGIVSGFSGSQGSTTSSTGPIQSSDT